MFSSTTEPVSRQGSLASNHSIRFLVEMPVKEQIVISLVVLMMEEEQPEGLSARKLVVETATPAGVVQPRCGASFPQ